MKKLLVLTVTAIALLAGQTEAQAHHTKATRCTYMELHTLQLNPVIQGWERWNLSVKAVTERELSKACDRVPARWRSYNRDFTQSTRFVDRLYPGKGYGAWAWNCASSEGGHGYFVMNRLGSGAGGWLQFMSGTFWSVIYDAVARARFQGVRIPSYALTWTSPIGQAIAGAEMLMQDRRGEWDGATC